MFWKERKIYIWKKYFLVFLIIVFEGIYLIKSLSIFLKELLSVVVRILWIYIMFRDILKFLGKYDLFDVIEKERLLEFS